MRRAIYFFIIGAVIETLCSVLVPEYLELYSEDNAIKMLIIITACPAIILSSWYLTHRLLDYEDKASERFVARVFGHDENIYRRHSGFEYFEGFGGNQSDIFAKMIKALLAFVPASIGLGYATVRGAAFLLSFFNWAESIGENLFALRILNVDLSQLTPVPPFHPALMPVAVGALVGLSIAVILQFGIILAYLIADYFSD